MSEKWTLAIEDNTRYDVVTGQKYSQRYYLIKNQAAKTIACLYDHVMGAEEKILTVGNMMASAPDLFEALSQIALKDPRKVSREEAADMACEFHILAAEVLKAKGDS